MMSEQKKDQTFLEVKDLKVEYFSDGQVVHAVNGVSLKIERGKTCLLYTSIHQREYSNCLWGH